MFITLEQLRLKTMCSSSGSLGFLYATHQIRPISRNYRSSQNVTQYLPHAATGGESPGGETQLRVDGFMADIEEQSQQRS